ncbi:MAG: hypothetical protein IJW23_03420 [Lentisphaeria bacterium]|nr:hypothetical protein [Lentisphaeria bacterium]
MENDNKDLTLEQNVSEDGVFSSGMDMLVKSLKAVFILLSSLILILLIWFFTFSGFFTVRPDTAVIVLQFGKFKEIYTDDWHWVFPYPVSKIIEIPTTPQSLTSNTYMPANEKLITDRKNNPQGGETLVPGVDGYLITADACIIHTSWSMTYRITAPKRYYETCLTPAAPADADENLKNSKGEDIGTRGPRTLLRNVLDNAVLQVTAKWKVNDIIFNRTNEYRMEVESFVRRQIAALDIGISVETVSLGVKSPPPQTINAFNEVTSAETYAKSEEDKAKAYAAKRIALAESERNILISEAKNYKLRVVAEVRADANTFKKLLPEYLKNPESITVALFTQTVADALSTAKDKFIVNSLPGGRQEIRLKLNPEPKTDKKVVDKSRKEGGK